MSIHSHRFRQVIAGVAAVLSLAALLIAGVAPSEQAGATTASIQVDIPNFDANYNQMTKFDTTGAALDAHEGQLLQAQDGTFWLYGEYHNCGVMWKILTTPWCGISMYSSPDLMHWTKQGLAFDSAGKWQTYCNGNQWGCYRPRVEFSPNTNRYVMWLNGYGQPDNPAKYWVFTSPSPAGPFTEVSPLPRDWAGNHLLGDEDLFVDDDASHTGYLAFMDWTQQSLGVIKLDATYSQPAPGAVPTYLNISAVEAPAMFKSGSTYYLTMSDPNCGYCYPNDGTSYVSSASPLGPWSTRNWVSPHVPAAQFVSQRVDSAAGRGSCGGQPSAVTPIQTVDSAGNLQTRYLYQVDQNTATAQNQGPANVYWSLLSIPSPGTISQLTTCERTSSFRIPTVTVGTPAVVPNLDSDSGRVGFHSECSSATVTKDHQLQQTFTPNTTGTLARLSVTAYQRYLAPPPADDSPDAGLTAEIWSARTDGSLATRLSSTTIARSPRGVAVGPNEIGWSPRPVAIYPNVSLSYGTRYALVLSTTGKGCYGVEFSSASAAYVRGAVLQRTGTGAWAPAPWFAIGFSAQVMPASTPMINVPTRACLSADSALGNGAPAALAACRISDAKQRIGPGILSTDASDMVVQFDLEGAYGCLDVAYEATADGSPVVRGACSGHSSQHWALVANSDATYSIRNLNSGTCLDGGSVGSALGRSITIRACAGTPQQRWILDPHMAPVHLGSSTLPAATYGASYATRLAVSSVPDATCSISAGSLPAGLTLATDCSIAGTPTVPGVASAAITATNSLGSIQFPIGISVSGVAPSITSPPPANATLGMPYSFASSATGQPTPTAYTVTGSLPPGITFNPTAHTLSGTPTSRGSYTFSLTVSNGILPNATATYSVVVSPSLSIVDRPYNVVSGVQLVRVGGAIDIAGAGWPAYGTATAALCNTSGQSCTQPIDGSTCGGVRTSITGTIESNCGAGILSAPGAPGLYRLSVTVSSVSSSATSAPWAMPQLEIVGTPALAVVRTSATTISVSGSGWTDLTTPHVPSVSLYQYGDVTPGSCRTHADWVNGRCRSLDQPTTLASTFWNLLGRYGDFGAVAVPVISGATFMLGYGGGFLASAAVP